ncbi:hypothetical protein ACP4OV_005415 [Aristida adscensionis]
MIAWGDIYKVVAAMAPLYFALGLGYGSVRWWRFFTPDQCAAINTLVVHFSMPFFTFDFAARTDPYNMNYRVLAADAVSKLLTIAAMAAWALCCRGGGKGGARRSWPITGFSLATLNNTLVVGVPLLDAMYGRWAQDLIVQIAVVQALVWFPLLQLAFELRRACLGIPSSDTASAVAVAVASAAAAADADESARAASSDPGGRVKPLSTSSPPSSTLSDEKLVDGGADDVEMNAGGARARIRLGPMVRAVALKMARNPNVYASVLGVAWACVAYRWRLSMPGIVTGSLQVMSRTGTGMSMFSMGLFMAQQKKVMACGARLAALGMALRFVAGPASTLVGAAALGLRGDVLRLAIIQAALPQSIASFVFAKEYGLHADLLSTAVIFGTLVSLPVLVAYYAVLGIV